MQFLCDVHISIKLVKFLISSGHSALHVNQLPAKWNSTDWEICTIADQKELIVITKDEDFRNSFFLRQSPKKLVRVLLGNISNQALNELFSKNLPLIEELNANHSFYLELGSSSTIYTP